MTSFKRLKPRLESWYRWHTTATSMFDEGKNKLAAPIFFALVLGAIAALICISNSYFWALVPAVLLSALVGGAIGDLGYWFVLAGDIQIERELSGRLRVIEDAVKQSEAVIDYHAPEMDSARRYFKRVRTKLAQVNQVWYSEGIGQWCQRVEENIGSELAVLVHILNKVHRQKQPGWTNLDVPRGERNRPHCHHPRDHYPREHNPHWCSYCYEDVFHKLAAPLLQSIPKKA